MSIAILHSTATCSHHGAEAQVQWLLLRIRNNIRLGSLLSSQQYRHEHTDMKLSSRKAVLVTRGTSESQVPGQARPDCPDNTVKAAQNDLFAKDLSSKADQSA